MKFLEKDLEQIIYEADKKELSNRGLTINGHIKRQLRIGNYGISDLISIRRYFGKLIITIYELKQNEINVSTLLQALRYAKGVSDYINNFRGKRIEIEYRIVLVGSIVADSDFIYLPEFVDIVKIYTYNYKFSGIYFSEIGTFRLTNNGFNG